MGGRLTALAIGRPMKAGMHPDGDGLYLQVGGSGARSWVYRYTLDGKQHYLGLGSAHAIPLKRARELAAEARRLRAEGVDPITQRRSERLAGRVKSARATMFRQCALAYIDAHEAGWRNPKHRRQWRSTLERYIFPTLGPLPVQDIDTSLVLKVLEPIWRQKVETAARVRGRIEAVLNFATAREYRVGPNPALWRGHLDHLLPAKSKVRSVEHHRALPYQEIPVFMADLRKQQSISARALETVILCAVRTSEALGARWHEFDLGSGTWVIPSTRTKTKREHRVPLSPRVLAILRDLHARRESEYVFNGARAGRPLSSMSLLLVLKVMGRADMATVHGFRSCFRTWASEQTNFPHEVCEQALAHTISNAVERAYNRTDLFDRRRKLMEAWAAFCAKPASDTGKVLPLRAVHPV